MSFLYFAYGSNLWPPQIHSRCPSARFVATASISGWRAVYDKSSSDGSAKLNLRPGPGETTHGVVYDIADDERADLDRAEPGYIPFQVAATPPVGPPMEALTYRWNHPGTDALPYDWYVASVVRGALCHGMDVDHIDEVLETATRPDPLAPDIGPADETDLLAMQSLLSRSLSNPTRYTIHPGDLAWWVWHADPKCIVSYWMRSESGLIVAEAKAEDIGVFTPTGESAAPLVEWAQRRFGGRARVCRVSDADDVLISYLSDRSYRPNDEDLVFHWDLDATPVPDPELPLGWVLRPVEGEHEASSRRAASHAAFGSDMSPGTHLERYLRFMRSPVYDPDRDLVAVDESGIVGAFMIWWADRSGVAEIEPFGTHPEHRRLGVGRALIYYGLRRMRDAGMSLARVVTESDRFPAAVFYDSVGFERVGALRRWSPPGSEHFVSG